jgi:hypothetical protein
MSKRRNPRKNEKQGIGPRDALKQKDNPAERKVPLMTEIPPSPSNSEKTKKRWYQTIDGWKTTLEIIAIPFAIIYAIVTFFEWRDLKHNFMIEQRAWLSPEYIYTPRPNGNIPLSSVRVTLTNSGKNPAMRIRVDVIEQIVKSDIPPSLSLTAPRMFIVSGLIFPGKSGQFEGELAGPEGTPARDFTDKEINDLLAGKSYLATYGQVIYDDQFGEHWTRFCDWKSFSSDLQSNEYFSAGPCTVWNDIGDGPPPKQK